MTARTGRNIRIRRGSTPVAGAKSDRITLNSGSVDITDKDAAGVQTLLADVSVRSVELQVEGITRDATFIAIMTGSTTAMLENYTVLITGLGTFSGNFMPTSLELSGEQEGAVEFSMSLASSGVFTWTPA